MCVSVSVCLCKIKYKIKDSLNMFAYFSIHINNFNVKKSPKKKVYNYWKISI